MLFESFPVGPLACNCTILGDEATREAIVIDPGDDVSRIHMRLSELGLKLKQILVTHGHIDHVGGALKLKRLTGAPIYLNENDLPQLDIMEEQASWLGAGQSARNRCRRTKAWLKAKWSAWSIIRPRCCTRRDIRKVRSASTLLR